MLLQNNALERDLHLASHGFPPGTTTLPDNKSRFLANFAKGSIEIDFGFGTQSVVQTPNQQSAINNLSISPSLRGPSSFFVALRGYLFSLVCRSEARPRWYSCDPSVVRSRQSRRRLRTSSQCSDVQDRCMVSWISATARASLNPGSPCFRLATELRNSTASINLRSS